MANNALNRLVKTFTYEGLNNATNNFTPVDINGAYKERISYDANGNIQTYLRNSETGTAKNNYSYTYTSGTNRLTGITNSVNTQTKMYGYDEIGNTTADGMQGMTNGVWNVYGKLQSATNKDGVNVIYTYSSDGQRISKKIGNTEEWYVRDASGNIMATYKNDASINSGDLSVTEIYKYGSSLLSVKDARINVENPVADNGIYTFESGNDNYILGDANGNTKLTIRDTRTQVPDPANPLLVLYYKAVVSTATFHSSYGANAKTYNGGFEQANFNGQRKSLEIGADAQTAEFWEYNGDVGRRWNVDPIPKHFLSNYSVFGGNPLLYSDPSGADFFKDKKGNIVWNNHHGKEGSKFKIKGKRYTNVGTSLTIRTNSEIRLPTDIAIGDFVAGSKLINKYTITGEYDKDGKFTRFTSTFERKTGATEIMPGLKIPGTESVSGKSNIDFPITKIGGTWVGYFEQHTQVNNAEAPGLKLYSGGNIVDVNVGVGVMIGSDGKFNLTIQHGTFPSVRMDIQFGKNPFAAIYDYQQASYTFSHITNQFTAAATVQKANQMATFQYYHNYLSQKLINQSWVKFLGFNAGK